MNMPETVAGWQAAGVAAGMPVTSLRRLVQRGKLPVERTADGHHRFLLSDLVAARAQAPPRVASTPTVSPAPASSPPASMTSNTVPAATGQPAVPAPTQAPQPTTDGRTAAGAFAAFNSGERPTEVVVTLEAPPEVIRELHRQWLQMNGNVLLPAEVAAGINKQAGLSRLDTRGLTQLIADLLRDREELRQFTFSCGECGKPARASSKVWEWLIEQGHLRPWCHTACLRGDAKQGAADCEDEPGDGESGNDGDDAKNR